MSANLNGSQGATNRPEHEPEYMRIPAVMERYSLSRSGIYRAAGEGKIVFIKCGRSTLVEVASVRKFLASLPRASLRSTATTE
jgi:hypothetical protein